MATAEDAKKALQKQPEPPKSAELQKYESIQDLLKNMSPAMKDLLPKYMTADRMARLALINFRNNQKLMNCSLQSIAGAIVQSVQLGLEPVLGFAHLIPYGNQCQLQIGYPGYVDLFYRHENSGMIEAHEVCENDFFEFQLGTNAFIKHIPAESNRGGAIKYYCVIELKTGFKKFEVMSRDEVEKHARKYSQGYRSGKQDNSWFTAFDSMALKTVALKTLKFAPKSANLMNAIIADGSMKDFTGKEENMFEIIPEYETLDDGTIIAEGGEIIIKNTDEKKTVKPEVKKATKKEEVIEKAEVISEKTEQEKEAEEVGKLI